MGKCKNQTTNSSNGEDSGPWLLEYQSKNDKEHAGDKKTISKQSVLDLGNLAPQSQSIDTHSQIYSSYSYVICILFPLSILHVLTGYGPRQTPAVYFVPD
jgi:hypothetical protein